MVSVERLSTGIAMLSLSIPLNVLENGPAKIVNFSRAIRGRARFNLDLTRFTMLSIFKYHARCSPDYSVTLTHTLAMMATATKNHFVA